MCAYISLAVYFFFYYTYLTIMYLLFHKSELVYIRISIYLNQMI